MVQQLSSFFIMEQFQAPLSSAIQKEYNKLIELISRVPSEHYEIKKIAGTGGVVSVADIVAYQIGWGTLLIGWYEMGVARKEPDMPGAGFKTWDYVGLARHFYAKYRYPSMAEQIRVFSEVVRRILDIVECEYRTGNVDKIGVWPWCTLSSGRQWPLSKLITVNTCAPYKRAARMIRTVSGKFWIV
jgi:hypothetical protein